MKKCGGVFKTRGRRQFAMQRRVFEATDIFQSHYVKGKWINSLIRKSESLQQIGRIILHIYKLKAIKLI